MAQKIDFDVIILGSGPAGISAAIYTQRFALSTLLIGESYGGAIAQTHLIENYPGFKKSTGFDLMEQFRGNIETLGINLMDDYVNNLEYLDGGNFKIGMDFEGTRTSRSIIYCLGTEKRKLGIPGEEKLLGKGVSYCATCDGPFFKEKKIGIVGGSDTAAKEALYLSEIGQKVYIIYRKEKIRAEPINIERVKQRENIEIINNTNVVEILGEERVNAVKFDNGDIFKLDALFIEIGSDPLSEMAKKIGVNLNEKGEIIVDEQMKTNIPGFFSAGDVVNRREKQVVVAAGHGAIAAFSTREYIEDLR
ncbi:MAG: NAD(P)/FAD-dependent oxidoreductase [Promethearchaeota archaeon]